MAETVEHQRYLLVNYNVAFKNWMGLSNLKLAFAKSHVVANDELGLRWHHVFRHWNRCFIPPSSNQYSHFSAEMSLSRHSTFFPLNLVFRWLGQHAQLMPMKLLPKRRSTHTRSMPPSVLVEPTISRGIGMKMDPMWPNILCLQSVFLQNQPINCYMMKLLLTGTRFWIWHRKFQCFFFATFVTWFSLNLGLSTHGCRRKLRSWWVRTLTKISSTSTSIQPPPWFTIGASPCVSNAQHFAALDGLNK